MLRNLTNITFGDEARTKIMQGANELANAVKVTLGARGRNVAIDQGVGGSWKIVNDGVTVARSINPVDPLMSLGAYALKDCAAQTEDIAKDGTTTCVVLAQAMLAQGMKYVAFGSNPMDLKRGMEKAVEAIVEEIRDDAIMVRGDISAIRNIACISANNDKFIGDLIGIAVEEVGPTGIITTRESMTGESSVEIVPGAEFDRGFMHPYFATDPQRGTSTLDNPNILITDIKISSIDELEPILLKLGLEKSILIIAEDIDQMTLAKIIQNNMQGRTNITCVKAPGFGAVRGEMLEDLSLITGAKLVSSYKGDKLSEVVVEDLGTAEKVLIDKDKTTIVNGDENEEKITSLVEDIKTRITDSEEGYDKEKLEERLSRLTGGVATLMIGANTDVEMEEKKLRVDDALGAVKSAIEEGIVAGGGLELISAASRIRKDIGDNEDERFGVSIILESVKAPFFQIMKNAGLVPELIYAKVQEGKYKKGYNVNNNQYENLIESGIIDPAKVTITALSNAASSIAMLLTTEAVVSDQNEE